MQDSGLISAPGKEQATTVETKFARRDDVTGAPVVAAEKLSRIYGEEQAQVYALRDVDIAFRPATFSAVMGPSGSGKSTLMHVLAGLDRPNSGSVTIDGIELNGLNDKKLTLLRRQKIGFVFQFFNLLPMLTAEENITLPLRIAGEPVDEAPLRQLLGAVGLADRKDHRPAQLSGGQQQRVAIARALITRPSVVFADEPTGNLDSQSGRDILQLLRHAVDAMGQTIIMVTHDAQAAAIADRVIFLADGLIVRDEGHLTADRIFDVMKVLQ